MQPGAPWLAEVDWLLVRSAVQLRAWLLVHAARRDGLWLVTYKKQSGAAYVSRWDVLDELLCFGWIDGARKQVDAVFTAQYISPRRHDAWTAIYRVRATRLQAQGRMHALGIAAIARAHAQGTWFAGAEVDALSYPADLQETLQPGTPARDWFDQTAPSYRRNVLRWFASARTDATRQSRVRAIVQSAIAKQRIKHL